jgi:hypothetical protein
MSLGDVVPVDLGGAAVNGHHRRVASVVFNKAFASRALFMELQETGGTCGGLGPARGMLVGLDRKHFGH